MEYSNCGLLCRNRHSLVLFLSLLIVSCGSSGPGNSENPAVDTGDIPSEPTTPVPADGTVKLLDSGIEPNEILSIQQSAEINSNIQVSSEQTLVAGNVTDRLPVTADFDVRTSLTYTAPDAQVSMIPVLNDYSADSFETSEAIPGSWKRTYTDKGSLTDAASNDEDGLIGYNTQYLFSFPGLVLSVPDEAVGIGAHWAFSPRKGSSDL